MEAKDFIFQPSLINSNFMFSNGEIFLLLVLNFLIHFFVLGYLIHLVV